MSALLVYALLMLPFLWALAKRRRDNRERMRWMDLPEPPRHPMCRCVLIAFDDVAATDERAVS